MRARFPDSAGPSHLGEVSKFDANTLRRTYALPYSPAYGSSLLGDADDLVAGPVPRDELDPANGHVEVLGDEFAHRDVGLVVDRRRCGSHEQTPGALPADLVTLRPRDHPNFHQPRFHGRRHDTKRTFESRSVETVSLQRLATGNPPPVCGPQ